MEKKKKKEDEIYQKVKENAAIINLWKEIEKSKDWESPKARQLLPLELNQDPARYARMPERGFRAAMGEEINKVISESNQLIYQNLPKLLKNYSSEEIAQLLSFIPFTIDLKKIEDEKLKEIAKQHATITKLKEMPVSEYRRYIEGKYKEILEEGRLGGKPYASLTLSDEALEEEKDVYQLQETINYLIGNLEKLKKEKEKKS